MKLRRRARLVCRWELDGFLVGVPREDRWLKVSAEIVDVLRAASDPIDDDELLRYAEPDRRDELAASIQTLREFGLLTTDDGAADRESVGLWERWGSVTHRYHVSARDANYLVGSPERDAVAGEIVAEGGSPAIFKDYPGAPIVGLPRRPKPLDMRLDDAFANRRTHREFTDDPVDIDELSTLLFYGFAPIRFLDGAQFGVQQGRASASAGGRHEVECYVVAHNIRGVAPGLYHYSPRQHALELLSDSVGRAEVRALTYDQAPAYSGALTIFTTAVANRLAWKYRHPRAYRLWLHDAGHYAQTYALACTALGLGPFQTIAFQDSAVERLLGVDPDDEFAVYLLAAGVPAGATAGRPADFRYPPPTVLR